MVTITVVSLLTRKEIICALSFTTQVPVKYMYRVRHWSIVLSRIQVRYCYYVNILRPRRNGSHFTDDVFKCIFLNENVWISLKISLKLVPMVPFNNIRALVQIMAWRRPGDKPLSEPMMAVLPTHIRITRPQWVKHGSVSVRLKQLNTSWPIEALWHFIFLLRLSIRITYQPKAVSHEVLLHTKTIAWWNIKGITE